MCKTVRDETDIKTYAAALRQADREAFWTLVTALGLAVFFWSAIFLLHDETRSWWGIPLWAWVAIIGGYVLSVAAVWLLIRFVFRDFSLDLLPKIKS